MFRMINFGKGHAKVNGHFLLHLDGVYKVLQWEKLQSLILCTKIDIFDKFYIKKWEIVTSSR